jgi:aspartyl-tRNA(Asn)/glutamyl-tRNA(Gln) amidotransferase subunit A
VAAFHVPLALGTDTGGSIRQPAALTGTVGMKPTYGRVSRYGIVAFASSLDQIGPFAATRATPPRCSTPCAGGDDRDSTSSPAPVPDELLSLPADDDQAVSALRGKRLGLPASTSSPAWSPGGGTRP